MTRARRAAPVAAVVLTAVVMLGACGSGGGSSGSPATSSTRGGASGKVVAVDETANGKTVTLARGGRLVVTLHSTYWQLAAPADPKILAVSSEPVARPGPTCPSIPGTGCGTVTARYAAAGTGTTTLTAHRDSCGEALRCTPAQSDWSVTVRVTA